MLPYIIQASENFIKEQMHTTISTATPVDITDAITTYIVIYTDSKSYKVSICYEKNLLQQITTTFLAEENSSDETLQEMALETTNMIVGSAKLLVLDDEKAFSIKTPFLDKNPDTHHCSALKVADEHFSILIEEIIDGN